MPPIRDTANVPGPFYVEDTMCMSCGAPEAESDGLMTHAGTHGGCVFVRQPVTVEETNAAIRAVWASCCGAVRYAGDDQQILFRLANIGCPLACDNQPPSTLLKRRGYAQFIFNADESLDEVPERFLLSYLAEAFPLNQYSAREDFAFARDTASFRLRWGISGNEKEHVIKINLTQRPDASWLLVLSENERAITGTAIPLDKRLRTLTSVSAIRWYTAEELADNASGEPHPY